MRERNNHRNPGVVLCILACCSVLNAQPSSDKNAKYIISGTGIFGGYGFFTLSSADVLPKGKFSAGGAYESRTIGELASMKYSVGLGLANRAEAFVAFSSSLSNARNDITQAALKVNILQGNVRDDFLGTVEIGYLQADQEVNGIPSSYRTFVGRLHAGLSFEDFEVFGNVGYAFQMGESIYRNRILFGAGAFVPLIPNVAVGAEISSDHSATTVNGLGFGAGAKISAFDHFQIILAGRLKMTDSRLVPALTLGLSFSSAFYHVAPGRKHNVSRIPPLPSLEELQKEEEKSS